MSGALVFLKIYVKLKLIWRIYSKKFRSLKKPSGIWRTVFDFEETKKEIKILEKQSQAPGFWDNNKEAAEISQKISDLKQEIDNLEFFKKEISDLKSLVLLENQDENFLKELESRYAELAVKISKEENRAFLSGKYDRNNAILEIFSGAGGQDSQDWATMLLRMYQRYCSLKGFKTEILHQAFGEGGGPDGRIGTKSATVEIKGNYAYGLLKKESGVHRLVRLSPFSSKKLRHTSFALVNILPEVKAIEADVGVKADDLKIDTFRASGPGGQYVNKTESAVRITHVPTGIVVSCQTERLQGKNKERALKILYSKLSQLKEESRKKELKEIKGGLISVHPHTKRGGVRALTGGTKENKPTSINKEGDTRSGVGASWGNQIRSYVLHPYKMAKDLRTQYETSDVEGVLDGKLEEFIEAELRDINE